MNTDSFIDRWNRMGKQRQLLTVLMALAKQMKMTEIPIPLTALDDITPGESMLMIVSGSDLVLRYSPEQTELLTIQEGSSAWTTQNVPSPLEKLQRASTLTDQTQVQAEEKIARAEQLRRAASRVRNKGLENLTDDLPPLS